MAGNKLGFTTKEVRKGGHYELFISPPVESSEELRSLLNTLWTFPSLAGCGKTRFEADAVPRNSLVSTAQADKKKACVEKTSSS
jgi:hypothetical protein